MTHSHFCPACQCGAGSAGPHCRPTRRAVVGALAAAIALPASGATAVLRPASDQPNAGVIDVHHHIVPPAFVAYDSTLPDWIRAWRPERSIEAMDRHGIASAITSLNAPALSTAKPQEARSVSRECNEYAARMGQDHPGRFGMFASLAPLDVEGALREATYALDVLHADGVALLTSYHGSYLASTKFTPLFEELNRRKAVVFVHPAIPNIGAEFDPPLSPIFLEMPYDSARTMMGMILDGMFARYPDIRFIFNHGGGGLPVLHKRLDLTIQGDPKLRDRFPGGVMAQLSNVYFDTVNVLNPANFALLSHLVAIDKLLFGTDFPGFEVEVNLAPLRALPAGEARLIGRDNALRLFPRLGNVAARAVGTA